MLKKWEDLPEFIRVPEVRAYWDSLKKKRVQMFLKRIFDVIISAALLVVLALPMAVISVCIKADSPGSIMYRQERITAYGKRFKIHKFRTMVSDADKMGAQVTASNDARVTNIGKKLRRLRLDEIPQIFDVLAGNMSIVGTRPEVAEYVEQYKPEYRATLLMPAGITSEASIRYKEESTLLADANDTDRVYVNEILPEKMKWNLLSIKNFSLYKDILTMLRTVIAVFGSDNKNDFNKTA